eukprot:gb/GECG01013063.1/.p1 GENE.gb/GECG01013063.1/~~gb/GECG01013063.1/.p1  ORF type:complete len:132 (+),score=22.04 gb/GECG01013063.1/:1-396(+)
MQDNGEDDRKSSAQLEEQRKQEIRATAARELMAQKKDLQERISALQFSYYKWFVIGTVSSVPLTLMMKLKGPKKWLPFVTFASIGSIADYATAWRDSWPLRKQLYDIDAELDSRKQHLQDEKMVKGSKEDR